MRLRSGTRVGPYEVVSLLGAGGMAEVYRARDTRLGRDVAIKVVSEELARDGTLLERFEREAKLAASLTHPNVVALHDVGLHDGKPYFVTELLQGETLRERLTQGPIPLATALEWAAAMAQGLAAAHARGIVHRDLKPENVFITQDGHVKLIDFGIAKLAEEARDAAPHAMLDETLSPSGSRTGTGMVLGTPGYMSPEQVRGDPVDARTDLYSLGTVLYEMLAGHRAFPARSFVESGYAILHTEPEPLPTTIPPALVQVVQRCLEKDPTRRFQSARDLAFHLEVLRAPSGSGPPTVTEPKVAAQPVPSRRWAWPPAAGRAGLAIALVVLAVAVVQLTVRGRRPTAGTKLRLSQVTFAEGVESSPAWSGDGTSLAYSADVGNLRQIFSKILATGEEKRLTNSAFDDIQPASSPEGRTILFARSRKAGQRLEPGDVFGVYDDGDIWAIDVASGKETRLVENAFNPAYSPDGRRIAVDASWAGPRQIWIVDAQGHNPQQITSDVSEAVAHVRPRWSPDGRRIVFQNIERTKFDVRVVDVTSKALVWITNDLYQDIDPVWSPSGRFVYFSSYRSGGLNLWRTEIGRDGDPAGPPEQVTTGAGEDVQAALSADGKKLAFATLKQNADLWKLPVVPETGRAAGEPQEVVATTREDSRGAWSPDGKWIAFNSDRSGDMNIWLYSLVDGSTRQLTRGPGGDFQPTWSPDGQWIVFFSSRSGNADIWKVEVSSGKLAQLTKAPSIDINPFFSPDGQLIAYQSDQGGRLEIWLMSASGGEAHELTRVGSGGHFLRFSRDGRDIVFRCPTCGGKGQTMRVPVGGGDPQPLGEQAGGSHISFSPDFSKIMDVTGHKTLWVSPLAGGAPERVFEFTDPRIRIDYPVWSPDGRFVLFDRFRPQGGDIWVMEGFER